jgi:uncharacterized membrane protein
VSWCIFVYYLFIQVLGPSVSEEIIPFDCWKSYWQLLNISLMLLIVQLLQGVLCPYVAELQQHWHVIMTVCLAKHLVINIEAVILILTFIWQLPCLSGRYDLSVLYPRPFVRSIFVAHNEDKII